MTRNVGRRLVCQRKWRSVPSRNWPGGCWNGRWSRESPSAGPLGTRSTAMTATCGCGWSGETFPTCWPSRAMRSCGLGRTRVRARCGLTGWRLGLKSRAGVRLSAGDGAKGPRVYDWALVDIRPLREPGKGYWLLARRSVAKPEELAYYVCYGPAGTTPEELVRVAGTRWAIEECFEEAKGQSLPPRRRGWDWTNTRCAGGTAGTGTSPPCRGTGQALAMLAHAYLAVVRHQASSQGRLGEKGAAPVWTKG